MPQKPKLLITGIHSLLGKYLAEELKDDYEIVGWHHQGSRGVDITDEKKVKTKIEKIAPDIVIHLAALSNIDFCEKNPKKAHDVNVIGTQNILESLAGSPAHFIFASSSMVFDGNAAPYYESANPNPQTIYGRTKSTAEALVLDSDLKSVVFRASTLYGWPPKKARHNDLTYYLPLLSRSQPIHLVNDRFLNPLAAPRASAAISAIIQKQKTGIYHLGGEESLTRFSFVKKLSEIAKIKNPAELIPVTSNLFPNLTPRPKDITLNNQKMKQDLKITPLPLAEELKKLLNSK